MKFTEMSKEQREENINIAIDEFKEFMDVPEWILKCV